MKKNSLLLSHPPPSLFFFFTRQAAFFFLAVPFRCTFVTLLQLAHELLVHTPSNERNDADKGEMIGFFGDFGRAIGLFWESASPFRARRPRPPPLVRGQKAPPLSPPVLARPKMKVKHRQREL